jgi:hypothetical protein
MTSDLPRVSARIEAEYIAKLHIIAQRNFRSPSNQLAKILVDYIQAYEEKYGEIKIEDSRS